MVSFTAACIQMNSQDDVSANAAALEGFVRQAAAKGATFIATPENTFSMLPQGKAAYPSPQPGIDRCQSLARELKVFILIGSVHMPAEDGKFWNRSLLIDDQGHIHAHYDKIHLFDVTLKGGEVYSESARIAGGEAGVLAHLPLGKFGMTVCYDVRFAYLYRSLAQAGAEILTVPSAFTYLTGTAHWHTLLRARAIETGCYVIAPAQCGKHPGGRATYGHSLIIAPWGEILAEASESEPDVITAAIDTNKVTEARSMIPALRHDRFFGMKSY